jgi:hypothetical protein
MDGGNEVKVHAKTQTRKANSGRQDGKDGLEQRDLNRMKHRPHDGENRGIGVGVDSNGDGQIDRLPGFVYDGDQSDRVGVHGRMVLPPFVLGRPRKAADNQSPFHARVSSFTARYAG